MSLVQLVGFRCHHIICQKNSILKEAGPMLQFTFPFSSLASTQPHLILSSPRHHTTLPLHHLTTSLPRHLVTLSPHHPVTLSPCHPITLSPYHLATFSHHHHVMSSSTKAPYCPITLSSLPLSLPLSLSSPHPHPRHLVLFGPRSLDLYLDPRVSSVLFLSSPSSL